MTTTNKNEILNRLSSNKVLMDFYNAKNTMLNTHNS